WEGGLLRGLTPPGAGATSASSLTCFPRKSIEKLDRVAPLSGAGALIPSRASTAPLSKGLDSGWESRKSWCNQVLDLWCSSSVPVSKGTPPGCGRLFLGERSFGRARLLPSRQVNGLIIRSAVRRARRQT